MLRKIEGGRKRGQQKKKWLDGMTNSMDMSLSKLRELVMDRQACHAEVHEITKSWTLLSNCTEQTAVIPPKNQSFRTLWDGRCYHWASGGYPQVWSLQHWAFLDHIWAETAMCSLTFLLLCVSLQTSISVNCINSFTIYEGLFLSS